MDNNCNNYSNGNCSRAEGIHTIANGEAAFAQGYRVRADGAASHAEGGQTIAHQKCSHAEGFGTQAIGAASHAEGGQTIANAIYSHAEGIGTIASGAASHAEGQNTVASGSLSHAEGIETVASGRASHAEGIGTNTNMWAGAHIIGRYGDAEESYSWFIGNGTSAINRGLGAKWLASTGEMYIEGNAYNTNGADYAEMFEIYNESISFGYFVTLEGKQVRKANAQDEFILGVTSANPSLRGNSACFNWKNKYIEDEWGQRQYDIERIPAQKNKEGKIINSEKWVKFPKINPLWDSSRTYYSRIDRHEWVTVGLIGQILVRDDGTCKINEYCFPNDEGIATKSPQGYRVLERIGSNQVLIFITSLNNY